MCSTEEIRTAIKKAGIKIDVDNVDIDQTFEDIGLDSLDVFSIILEIEKQFNIKIPDEHIDQLQSIEKIKSYLNRLY